MIICPNCTKRIPTIPGKQLNITCTCKVTLRTDGHFLASYSKKGSFKDKPITLIYAFGTSTADQKEFYILDDNHKQMLMLNHHPNWNKLPQPDFEDKLKKFLIFS